MTTDLDLEVEYRGIPGPADWSFCSLGFTSEIQYGSSDLGLEIVDSSVSSGTITVRAYSNANVAWKNTFSATLKMYDSRADWAAPSTSEKLLKVKFQAACTENDLSGVEVTSIAEGVALTDQTYYSNSEGIARYGYLLDNLPRCLGWVIHDIYSTDTSYMQFTIANVNGNSVSSSTDKEAFDTCVAEAEAA